MAVGHVKWRDGRLADERMVPLAPGFDLREHRATLDEADPALWEMADGKPRDPWSESARLPMIDLRTKGRLTFSTSSVGGIRCVKQLIKGYVAQLQAAPETTTGHLPLVQLGSQPYQHPIKSRGTLYNPVLQGIDWLPSTAALPGGPAKEARQPAQRNDDLGDAIMF
jgi:hypothetical protein